MSGRLVKRIIQVVITKKKKSAHTHPKETKKKGFNVICKLKGEIFQPMQFEASSMLTDGNRLAVLVCLI